MKKGLKTLLVYLVLIAAIVLAVWYVSGVNQQEKIKYSEIYGYFENEQVYSFEVSNSNVLTLKLYSLNADGTVNHDKNALIEKEVTYELYSLSLFHNDIFETFVREQYDAGIIEWFDYEVPKDVSMWVSILPFVIILIIISAFSIFFMGRVNGGGPGGKINNFGKAKVKVPQNDKNKVLFRDVAGADEEKAELEEVVEFLKSPAKFTKLGAKIPHGVLLVGPPGTGKTLLAKAVAGEAGVPFFSISGSDFVEMYVGVGASRVRDLFDNARKAPASIIFIDEIDAVGRHRGAGLGGGHDEREQTLNQLLVEMDGFGSHDGIIVIAATNRPDILDPALLRPGRFDRQITVDYPDMKGREAILKVHARNKPLEASVDFNKIAQVTIGFTGADLANLLNEAALLAAKKNKSMIGMDDIEAAYMKELLGPQKKTKVRRDEDNKLVAYHEAGHAVVSHYCKKSDPIKHITIIPAGRTGGVTLRVPEEERFGSTKGEMLDDIRVSMGGRAAEELILDDISTGASGDIQQATRVARAMVTQYGMSDKLGTVLYGSGHSEVFLGRDYGSSKDYSGQTAAAIDEEIRRIVGDCHEDAKRILSEHIDKLHAVASFLIKHESMDGDQFKALMDEDADEARLLEIAEEKRKKSEEENEKRARENAEREALEKREAEEKKAMGGATVNEEQGFYRDDDLPH